ncbi:MAG: ORF6N domain-containing protein [Flavobacteriia bacterium]|nr:ORF6N domain-containing protein [Flavobacteriia bacterium]
MNDIIIPDEQIIRKVYLIRGQRVMLDRDLADLYQIKPFRLREQVKRNLNRFPKKFMFQLNKEETELLVSQNAIPSKSHLGGYLPLVFSEHGILQLSNVIKSEKAINISVCIIEVFIKMREMIISNQEILLKLSDMNKIIEGHEDRIDMIYEYLKQFIDSKSIQRSEIGYKSNIIKGKI